jgi:hypothetical protein
VDITLQAHSDKFDPDDEKWLAQEAELLAELRHEVDGVRREASASPGDKGFIDSIIMAIVSGGALTAALSCLQAWLSRDRTRRIELAWTVDGREEKIVLSGTGIDKQAMDRLTQLVQARLEK